jgi:pimeloyl-ACP methyl ester carboxylesterase
MNMLRERESQRCGHGQRNVCAGCESQWRQIAKGRIIMSANGAKRRDDTAHPWRYFALVQLLSIPFYVGTNSPIHGFPFFGWPVAIAIILVPAAIATTLTAREQGYRAALQLWSRIGDIRRIRTAHWVLFALLFPAAVTLISYGVVRFFHLPLPNVVKFSPAATPGLLTMFFIGAIPEEIGWTGYATEPLQQRYGVLGAGLIIGVLWVLWHVAMWWIGKGGWEGQNHALAVAGQAASVVLLRAVMGWVYAHGGRSLFLAIVLHAMDNTCWKLLPNNGSHYNPTVITAIVLGFTTFLIEHPSRRSAYLQNHEIEVSAGRIELHQRRMLLLRRRYAFRHGWDNAMKKVLMIFGVAMGSIILLPVANLALWSLIPPLSPHKLAKTGHFVSIDGIDTYYEREACDINRTPNAWDAMYWMQRALNFDFAIPDVTRIKSVTTPTLIIWGRDDRVAGFRIASRFRQDIAGSQLVVIDDVGHMVHEEKPDAVNHAITSFLDTIRW